MDERKRRLDPTRQLPESKERGGGKGPRPNAGFTESFSVERLRINHYGTKSIEEWRQKFALPRPDTGAGRPPPNPEFQAKRLDAKADDQAIMQYVPALRETLHARRRSVA